MWVSRSSPIAPVHPSSPINKEATFFPPFSTLFSTPHSSWIFFAQVPLAFFCLTWSTAHEGVGFRERRIRAARDEFEPRAPNDRSIKKWRNNTRTRTPASCCPLAGSGLAGHTRLLHTVRWRWRRFCSNDWVRMLTRRSCLPERPHRGLLASLPQDRPERVGRLSPRMVSLRLGDHWRPVSSAVDLYAVYCYHIWCAPSTSTISGTAC